MIEKEISLPDIKVVRNEEFEQGMGTSLRTVLAAVGPKSTAALIVLADQLAETPELGFRLLIGIFRAHSSISRPTQAQFAGSIHTPRPLLPIFVVPY